jgi:hypothetical protein
MDAASPRGEEVTMTASVPARASREIVSPRVLGIALVFAFACAACFSRQAQAQPAATPNKAPAAAQPKEAKAFAKLEARAHRLVAKIVEAEAADRPNLAKIDKLYAELQDVQQKMWALGSGPGGQWAGPWGGRGWGGGPGWGAGRGWGAGWGRGRGWGRGPGWGRARGPGPWAGPPGTRGGPFWVDKNKNGICDYYEQPRGPQDSATPKKNK